MLKAFVAKLPAIAAAAAAAWLLPPGWALDGRRRSSASSRAISSIVSNGFVR